MNPRHSFEVFTQQRSHFLAIGIAVILTFVLIGTAFAWTFLGTFSGTQYWSPNYGEEYAQIVDDGNRNRYIDTEASNFYYNSNRISLLQDTNNWTSIVFHAFRRDTNCFVNVTATGYWWTNYPYPSLHMKAANCEGENHSGNNEVRIWNTEASGLNAYYYYYAGAEYKDRKFESKGRRLAGEMNYDAYKCVFGGCKEWLTKFYWNRQNQFQ